MVILSFLSTLCKYEKYWMSLWCPQTHLQIPGFQHLQGAFKAFIDFLENNSFPLSHNQSYQFYLVNAQNLGVEDESAGISFDQSTFESNFELKLTKV
jgi:hypothetical protein